MKHAQPTILFICTAKASYSRNIRTIKALLSEHSVIVIASNSASYPLRIISVCARFLWIRCSRRYDFVYVGFLGQILVPFIRFICKKPLILDAFISIYDTLCFDRKDFAPRSLVGKAAYCFDRVSMHHASWVITDTNAHGEYFADIFRLPREKFLTLYIGTDTDTFYPRQQEAQDSFTVFFHGSYLPLHGIEYIIGAAKLLHKENIIFKLVGRGREKKKMLALAGKEKLKNVIFIDSLFLEELAQQIASSDICLGGHFSDNDKARRVIAGKTYLYLAMQKPTIVGDNSANHELFVHGEHVYMCAMADAHALADAIRVLKNDKNLSANIAYKGYARVKERCDNERFTQDVLHIIGKMQQK